tara:strand:- start:268 stop:495 length:228 start_codon:yes stop_codon:yes gene_type:complete
MTDVLYLSSTTLVAEFQHCSKIQSALLRKLTVPPGSVRQKSLSQKKQSAGAETVEGERVDERFRKEQEAAFRPSV